MGFTTDLAHGKVAEQLFLTILHNNGIEGVPNQCRATLLDYDVEFLLGERTILAEVKHDLYESRTGNIALEFWNTKKETPSGILATKADLWVHVLQKPQTVWVASVNRLKAYTARVKPIRIVENGGDGNANFMLYRSSSILPNLFRRIDQSATWELQDILGELLCPTE